MMLSRHILLDQRSTTRRAGSENTHDVGPLGMLILALHIGAALENAGKRFSAGS